MEPFTLSDSVESYFAQSPDHRVYPLRSRVFPAIDLGLWTDSQSLKRRAISAIERTIVLPIIVDRYESQTERDAAESSMAEDVREALRHSALRAVKVQAYNNVGILSGQYIGTHGEELVQRVQRITTHPQVVRYEQLSLSEKIRTVIDLREGHILLTLFFRSTNYSFGSTMKSSLSPSTSNRSEIAPISKKAWA